MAVFGSLHRQCEYSHNHFPARPDHSRKRCLHRLLCYHPPPPNNLCCQCSVTGWRKDLAAGSHQAIPASACIHMSVPVPAEGEPCRTRFELAPDFSRKRLSEEALVF